MPAYSVALLATAQTLKKNSVNAVTVFAANAADAVSAAQAQGSGGASDAAWAAATVTELAVRADLEGWRLRLVLTNPAGVAAIDVTVTGGAADVLNDIGDLMVIALNAEALIANSAYATPALTISSIADGIGDYTVTAWFMPPINDVLWEQPDVSFVTFLGAIVDGGIAGAVLTIQLVPGTALAQMHDRLAST